MYEKRCSEEKLLGFINKQDREVLASDKRGDGRGPSGKSDGINSLHRRGEPAAAQRRLLAPSYPPPLIGG
jgi:hypothetical protein